MMDEQTKIWLNDKFDSLEKHSKERMDAHMQLEAMTHLGIKEMLEEHKLALYGDGSDGSPGITKKLDRIETGLRIAHWAVGLVGAIASWATSKHLFK